MVPQTAVDRNRVVPSARSSDPFKIGCCRGQSAKRAADEGTGGEGGSLRRKREHTKSINQCDWRVQRNCNRNTDTRNGSKLQMVLTK
jgi:hypothetical protein